MYLYLYLYLYLHLSELWPVWVQLEWDLLDPLTSDSSFLSPAARFIPPFMTRPRPESYSADHFQKQWRWQRQSRTMAMTMALVSSAQVRLIRGIDGKTGCRRILFYREFMQLQFIGSNDASRIYWRSAALAPRPILSGSLNFLTRNHLTWRLLGWSFTFSQDTYKFVTSLNSF